MQIEYTNKEILAALLAGDISVKYNRMEDGNCLFSDAGLVGYVLRPDEIFFSLDKCVKHDFGFLLTEAPKVEPQNKLKITKDVQVGKHGVLLARLKAAEWDTFVDMDLLEAFDYPKFYQARCYGPIAIMEGDPGNEKLRGFVMPVKTGTEKDGHYNDPKVVEV